MSLNEKIIEFNKNVTLSDWRYWLIQDGNIPINDKRFRRPGKNKGHSMELYQKYGTWMLKNFSSNYDTNTRSSMTALFNYVKMKFFNGDVRNTALHLKIIDNNDKIIPTPKIEVKFDNAVIHQPVEIKYYDELQYRFDDYIEEEASKRALSSKNPRWVIDNQIIAKNPKVNKERVYSICVNPFCNVNKINADYNIPEKLHKTLETQGFYNIDVTKNDLIEFIVKGYSLLLGKFKHYPRKHEDDKNYFRKKLGYPPLDLPSCKDLIFDDFLHPTYRNADSFISSDLFGIDVDGTITLEDAFSKDEIQSALFIYTTKSHTEKENRFRIIFDLPGVVKSKEVYTSITKYYRKIFDGDPQATDAARIWYTNPNATIYDLTTGNIITYKDGKRND